MDTIREEKRRLRREVRRRIAALSPTQRAEEAELALHALTGLPEWSRCGTVLAFIAISRQQEIGTAGVLRRAAEEGKRVALPRMRGDVLEFRRVRPDSRGGFSPPLEEHPYGVQEPPEEAPLFEPAPEELCLVVTPGLAFDRSGGRLGRGKGYYDGWLARHRSLISKGRLVPAGFGYSVQLVERVPMDRSDVSLPLLVLAGELIRTGED